MSQRGHGRGCGVLFSIFKGLLFIQELYGGYLKLVEISKYKKKRANHDLRVFMGSIRIPAT